MTQAPDPYKVLQVDPEAEDEVIQAAYRRLAQKYHPDVATGPDADARMSAINAAWEVLGDPGRRAAFDLAITTLEKEFRFQLKRPLTADEYKMLWRNVQRAKGLSI